MNRWILNKIRNIDKRRMKKHIEIIKRNTGHSTLYILISMIKNFITMGCGYTDYYRCDFINLSSKEKSTFVTQKKFNKILNYLNDKRYEIILSDKLIFNNYFKNYIKRDFLDLKTCNYTEFINFTKTNKIFFAKKPISEGGHGVKKIDSKSDSNIKDVYEDLIKNGYYLLEEQIIQSKELNEINPYVVNSFRVITIYKDNKVYVVNNALRINKTDNPVIGSTEDLYCSFDKNGKINSNVIDDYGNIYIEHPLTKKKFSDVHIKDIREAFNMCKEAHSLLPNMRYIGWDIAFSTKGPLIIEGNEYPGYGIIQHYKLNNKKTGHLKEISDILKDEIENIDI